MKMIFSPLLAAAFLSIGACSTKNASSNTPPINKDTALGTVDMWLTTSDQSTLLKKQPAIKITTTSNPYNSIEIDSTQTFQTMDGFGYTLTGGSAFVLNQMAANDRAILLKELFGTGENSIGINFLRISIGASDMDASVYSFDDMPAGQTDPALAHFSLDSAKADLIPILKEITAINPNIKILATPWSPPAWMKDNESSIGGKLMTSNYDAYAQYFIKYILAMKNEGIGIYAITPQNEPLNPNNNPSLSMTADEQTDFIKNHLGPAFASASINAKIIIYDHNCDRPDYPLSVLNDAAASAFIDGSAFHLYAGDISALSSVHSTHPDKNVYFTEQYTPSNGDFGGDLQWHVKNLLIGAPNNWARTVLEWNLANDAAYGPHTPGGCTTCKGALTISGSYITRNVGYYIIAHASKFVPAGSVRIKSSTIAGVRNVAYQTPSGKKVLIVLNDGSSAVSFNVRINNRLAPTSLTPGSVATYVW